MGLIDYGGHNDRDIFIVFYNWYCFVNISRYNKNFRKFESFKMRFFGILEQGILKQDFLNDFFLNGEDISLFILWKQKTKQKRVIEVCTTKK